MQTAFWKLIYKMGFEDMLCDKPLLFLAILGIRKYVRRQRLPQKGDIFLWENVDIENPRVIQITRYQMLPIVFNLHVVLVYMQMHTMYNNRIISLSIDHMNSFIELFSA